MVKAAVLHMVFQGPKLMAASKSALGFPPPCPLSSELGALGAYEQAELKA